MILEVILITTQEKILAEAFKLFLSKGYSGVSINDIIDAVGITKGGFYHHFKSKEELFHKTMVNFTESQIKPYISFFENDKTSLREKLEFMSEKVVEVCNSEEIKTLFVDMNILYMEILKKHSKLFELFKDDYKKIQGLIVNAFEKEKEKGILRSDLDCEGAAFHFIAYLKGAGVYSLFLNVNDLSNNVQFFLEQFWNSVKV